MNEIRTRWQPIAIVLAVALSFWLPRGFGLAQYATADENAWLTRSANFYRALAHGDWAATFQRHHPGVTLTWAGTAGFLTTYPTYSSDADHDFGWLAEELTPFLREHGHEPVELLAAGRQMAVLAIVLALTLTFLLLWRAWGLAPALTGSLLLAFDPFHIAHSRLMHLDGLLSSYMILTVVALFVALNPMEERRWRWGALTISAVATALAVLTRSPGIFLLPFAALVVAVQWLRCFRQARNVRNVSLETKPITIKPIATKDATVFFLGSFLLWLLLVAAIFVLLWPAMWVAPMATLREVFSAAGDYAEAGHEDPIFFNGVIYNGDPGSAFYPLTLLWRTTPVVWIGVVLAALGLGLQYQPASESARKRTGLFYLSILLAVFAVGFWLLMNLGAKKFDRYLLPAYPALDLIAGVGVMMAGGWLAQRWKVRLQGYGQPALLVLLLLAQAGLALPHYPYYLTYYNPLLGGGRAAVHVMQIGRGEGANLAAAYLNEQMAGSKQQATTAVSTFPNGPFSYFFQGRTVPPTYWSMADYAVLYAQDVQRQLPSARQVAWLETLQPLTAITLQGIPYARVYALHDAPTPPFVTTWAQTETAQIRLNAYELTAGMVAPGTDLHTILYLQNLAPIAENLNVLVRLVGADGNELTRDEGWPWGAATSAWEAGAIWPDGHTLAIPADTPLGYYRLEVGFYEPEAQEQLRATQTQSGAELPALVPLDYIQIGSLPQEPTTPLAEPYQVGELATLLGYSTETSTGRQIDISRVPLLPGEDLHLSLYWRVGQGTATDYTTFIHVVDANGKMLTQLDAQPVLPTSLWHKGQVLVDTYTLTIPTGAALGEYPIVVGLYDLATVTRLPVQQGGELRGDSVPLTRLVIALSRSR